MYRIMADGTFNSALTTAIEDITGFLQQEIS